MKSMQRSSRSDPRHSRLTWLVAGLGLFAAKNVLAAEYYVSPTGSDSNPGTQASPFATLQKANDSAAAGDTIWMRAGKYGSTTQITLSKSGTSDTNRTKIWAYPGEVPVIDFSNYANASSGTDVPAILVTGSWMHLKGLEIANGKVGASGSHSYSMLRTKGTHNNTFELLNIHHGFGPGLFIDDTKGTGGHLILNCDSHDNYDVNGSQGDGQNADGFGVHYQPYQTGATTIVRGCRAWWNSDDGYDLINQEVPVLIDHCWVMGSGRANYGTTNPADGNGNGFKMGGSVNADVRRNWYNNTSLQNGTQYDMLAGGTAGSVVLTGSLMHVMRNNIGFPNKNNDMIGTDSQFNTWDLNITPKDSDFLSVTDPSLTTTGQPLETISPAMGPRQADGSLPNVDFLKLAAGSQMIDKGTDVGLPFVGAAPDLGAYEYGATGGTPGTAGATGTGGTPGTGGATGTGGRSGTGGATGATASAGATATGGKGGAGGTPIGGGIGTGGTPIAGAPATGGTTAIGGTRVTGGTTATGGKTGGSATGGLADTGGAIETGGSPMVTGGSVAIGGTPGTGGLSANGGVPATAGVEAGGTPAPGGTSGIVATGGTTSATASTAQASSGGCSCRIAEAQTRDQGVLALLGLIMVVLRVRRRR
jgi:MYXO-CTERM domain-containing protein